MIFWVWNEDVDIRLESFLTDHPHLFAYIDLVGHINGLPMKSYLTFMAQRILERHRILKESGSLYLHCDPVADSYLRIILDYVLEIIILEMKLFGFIMISRLP